MCPSFADVLFSPCSRSLLNPIGCVNDNGSPLSDASLICNAPLLHDRDTPPHPGEAKYPDGKYPSRSKRYKYDPWGEDEVDFIVEKFKEVRCGRQEQAANGSWKDVATMGKKAGILKESRSPQDVRDKIRGLIKNGKIEIDGHVLRSVTDPIEPEAAAAPEAADDDQIEATP